MYKVMLIDDERVIRQGLRKLIDWTSIGYEIVDEAEDGISALEKIQCHLPDLVLLDIRMPGMDGMDLLKKMRELNISTKVIFLTGYAEFEYAKKAIPLGVEAFLTKPINEDELEQYLIETHKKLDQENLITGRLNAQLVLEEKQLYRRLLFGQKLNQTRIKFEKALYTVAEIQFYEDIQVVNAFFDKFQRNNSSITCLLVAGSWVLIFKDMSLSRIKVFLYDLSNKMKKEFIKDFFICVGRQVTSIHTLHISFEDVKLLGQRWFLSDDYSIVYYEEQVESSEVAFFIDSDLLYSYIEVNNTDDIEVFFKALESSIRAQNMDFNKIKGLCSNCLLIVIERIKQNYSVVLDIPQNQTVSEEIYQQKKLSTLILCMKKYIDRMQAIIHNGSRESTMTKILDYIGSHYEKDLKLERLGKIFGYNSSYLGTIFKQETGMSYSKYLDSIRIEEAKKLLLEHNNKVYEIAQMVGYNSVDYFHGKFKKYVHMSPKQFQLEHRQNEKELGE
ncbi:MAG: response regulator transcription factor [Clostridiales bacterium]|nr:response regulator transcription factor [Clostridiales bacterium]